MTFLMPRTLSPVSSPRCSFNLAKQRSTPVLLLYSSCLLYTSYVQALKATIDPDKDNLEVILVDKHMNDPECADFLAELLLEMLKGKWTKGNRADHPFVIPF